MCVVYLTLPKLLNFSKDSIKKSLKINNNININNIYKVNYKIFPTPRLNIPHSNFTIGEEIVEVSDSEIEIVLNISQILNFKEINYKKLLINKGSSKINFNTTNQLISLVNKNKRKLTFRNNDFILFQDDRIFFEINDSLIKINQSGEKNFLTLNGKFLDKKIFIKFNNTLENKNNFTLKIPELDIATRVFFEKNNSNNTSGFFNIEVFNNFLKFNFIKDDIIRLTKGFIRSELINTSIEGEISINPNFFLKLDFEPSNLNMKKLFPLIQKIYFSDNTHNLSLIKKINGIFNITSKIEGEIINKNGEVLFNDFKVVKNKSLSFNARISEFGKRGKIHFNLFKSLKYKRNLSKKIRIIGFLSPSISKVIFEKVSVDGSDLSLLKTKEYEREFEDKIIMNSLANFFSASKIDKYLKNLF